MFKRTKVCVGVLAALGGGLLLSPLSVSAQTTGERIEITGSRLKTFETETASPVVTLDAAQIKADGVQNVEQLLNNLPQVFADQGAQVSNGSTGTATVNLRNLGSTRTLVLINGRRLPAGDPADPSVDLNQIPISLVKRVEVLTGGASAVYGSDAIAGVVNFIMRDDFQGVQLSVNTQFYNHQQHNSINDVVAARGFVTPGNQTADGQVHDFSLTLGSNFAGDKGNATLFFGYKKEQALLESHRDFSACALSAGKTGWACGGSGTSYPGYFTDFSTYGYTVADANGGIRDYVGATDAYNYQPLNYFQRPSDRYNINASGHYNISDAARVYTELSFADDSTVAQIAPSGLFFFSAAGPNAIHYENPLLSQAWKDAFNTANQALATPTTFNKVGDTTDLYIGRRNIEGGGRRDDMRHTTFRSVLGIKGDVGAWSYDVSAQTGKMLYQETYFNDFSNVRIAKALDVVTDPNTGLPACRSFVDGTDPNCVPYDIWSLGKVTPAAVNYLATPGFKRGSTSQSVLTASLSGDLTDYGIKSPLAKSGMGVVVGVEHRTEGLKLDTDTAFTTGDLAGQGGPTIGLGGSYNVNDFFSEVRLPIMEKQPGAELLNLTGSYRRSSYSTDKTTNTYGLGLEYAPVKTVKLRGSYQSAARAANIVELYSAQSLGLYDNANGDPCAGTTPTASAADCARTGVTAAQYGHIVDSPAAQYNAIFGGNPNLKPETSKSYTLGLVVNPIKELSVTLDYFNIKVDGVVGTAPATTTLTQCLNTGDPAFCGLIHRDAPGTLWATPDAYILASNANLGMKHTSGLDVGLDYGMKLANYGGLNFSFLGTKLQKFEAEDIPGVGVYDCAGLFGDTCGTPLPKWRHKLRTTWNTPWDASFSLTWRYISAVDIDASSSNPQLAGSYQPYQKTLGAMNYFDLFASYAISKHVTVQAYINNLFDKDPPIRANGSGFVNGNTYPVVYDALGRRIGLGLTATF